MEVHARPLQDKDYRCSNQLLDGSHMVTKMYNLLLSTKRKRETYGRLLQASSKCVVCSNERQEGNKYVSFFLSFFWSGHRDQISCSVLGGFPKPRTAAIQSLESVPIVRIMCYVPLMALVPPLSSLPSPPWYPPARSPCLQKIFQLVHVSPLLLPPLRPFSVYLPPPTVAPVVTRRPPVRLTGGRCHAAPGFLSSVLMFGGLPPRPVRLAVLGLGVGGGA